MVCVLGDHRHSTTGKGSQNAPLKFQHFIHYLKVNTLSESAVLDELSKEWPGRQTDIIINPVSWQEFRTVQAFNEDQAISKLNSSCDKDPK